MPRTFTVTERKYMARLAARNTTNPEPDQEPTAGRDTPMPAEERMRRKRIRDKADTAMRDLVVADAAGIIDLGELQKSHDIGMALGLTEQENADTAFWMFLGNPPEDVSIQTE